MPITRRRRTAARRRRYLVCSSCRRREYRLTRHNLACGRCWACHKSAPCYIEEETL